MAVSYTHLDVYKRQHPTFTKGTDGIITTYTDGTTYTVPYSDVITYDYLAKKKTINVGENPNWGDPKQYFTYEDGGAIGNDKTFLWENSRNTTAPNNPDLTVGTNKRVEVLAPNPEGGALKTLTVTYDVVDGQPQMCIRDSLNLVPISWWEHLVAFWT